MDRWPQTNCCPLWALIYSDRGDLCDHWGLGLFWSKSLRFSSVCCILAQWSGSESRSVMSDTLQTHGLYNPWNSPGQNIGVGSLSFSRGSSQLKNRTGVSCLAGRFFINWAIREAHRASEFLPNGGIVTITKALLAFGKVIPILGSSESCRRGIHREIYELSKDKCSC